MVFGEACVGDLSGSPGESCKIRVSGAKVGCWADFAAEIFVQSTARGGPTARVRPIATADYPTPAKRPGWSWLDGGRLQKVHGVVLPDWRDGLRRTIDRLEAAGEWR